MRRYTPAEYLRLERDATERHQYFEGEIFGIYSAPTVTRGSADHGHLVANVIRSMGDRLEGSPCSVFDSNLRMRIPRSTHLTCPDVIVVRGRLQIDSLDPRQEVALNPTLIVEVTSPASEAYDRGEKFGFYQCIEPLQEYVLVSHDAARVEAYLRHLNGTW